MLFVGVDGLSFQVIGPMLEAGELPAFRRLLEGGASMPRFETLSTTSSPLVWTTVATGRDWREHGVDDYTETLADGTVIPVTSGSRKVKAIWEVATEQGRSVGVLGWWASWPAEEVDGYVVSDHANPLFTAFLAADETYYTADPAKMRALERSVHPPELGAELEPHWLSVDAFPYDELERRSGLTAEQMAELRAAPWNERSRYSILRAFYAVDLPLHTAARDLWQRRPTDLQLLYLRGPDPIQHYAWDLVEPQAYPEPPPDLERDRGLVEAVYRYVDGMLGEILDGLDEDVWLIVASDHGAEPAPGSDSPRYEGRPGGHTPAAKGVLFLFGPGVVAGERLERGDPKDLMPTMAWLLGLPLARDLDGRPLTEAFEPELVAQLRPKRIRAYGERTTEPGLASAADEALLESLRALGYIE